MRTLTVAALGLVLLGGNAAQAVSCRDANGKFVTCPKPTAKKCRDAKGKFAACPVASPPAHG